MTRRQLVRISAGLGLGPSLASAVGRADTRLAGFHLVTFDEVARTEAWRQEWLARLAAR
ncbi:hypothetical protein ACI8AF_17945 [Blastococcus sp. SYSU D00669]